MSAALRRCLLLLAAVVAVLAQPSSAPAAAASNAHALPECARLPALLACDTCADVPPAPSCALLVFRHVQKTGGSTLRNFFRLQEATGDWEFYRRAPERRVHRRRMP